MKFGEHIEVGPVDACDKCKGDKYDRKNSQEFHDIVHSATDNSVIDMQLVGQDLSVVIRRFRGQIDII